MTSLGYEIVKSKTNSKWLVTMEVSGDLSFSYNVRPIKALFPDGSLGGTGIPANKLSDVDKIISLANKYGYDKAYDIWYETRIKDMNYLFGYLKGKKAEKYARDV